jgi:glycosyltransferase involved in cell wall biosynthesis
MRLKVHFTPGDGKGWALDEDLRQIRASLQGKIRESSAAAAQVIHAPFWQNLAMVEPGILRRAFVIAHADNPPFFYVKQPEFALGQTWVDLWVARSNEALEQFQALRLPAVHIPYTIDPKLFFPIEDKNALRHEFGIPEDTYVIANFHRDTEGADLKTPKFQKAPEMMVAILKRVRQAGASFHVLLAGPRRHWIRAELDREGIPFTFVGQAGIAGDDFGKNILSRETLNKLYNAADLHLVPSRWEGGPQSAMEAAACRLKQLCPPIGVARDILEPISLFESAPQAAEKIIDDIRKSTLAPTIERQFSRWHSSHTTPTLAAELVKLYEGLPSNEVFQNKIPAQRPSFLAAQISQLRFTIQRRTHTPNIPAVVHWNHLPGKNPDLDEIMAIVREKLEGWKIIFTNSSDAGCDIAGWPIQDVAPKRHAFQFFVPGFPIEKLLPGATLIAPAVQDILNLRALDILNPAVVLPVPLKAKSNDGGVFCVMSGDVAASVHISRALSAGRPILYPIDSAYREQVFWGGIPYKDDVDAVHSAIPTPQEFLNLTKTPDSKAVEQNLRKLISFKHA